MRRRNIILVLSVIVAVFCFHNVYQSYVIVHDGGGGWAIQAGRSLIWNGQDTTVNTSPGDRGAIQQQKQDTQNVQDSKSPQKSHLAPRVAKNLINNTRDGRERSRNATKDGVQLRDEFELYWDNKATRPEFNLSFIDPPSAKPNCAFNLTSPVYRDINGTSRYVPLWQLKLEACGQLGRTVNGTRMFYLAELLQVRVYEEDKARWTVAELKQWIHYMLLIGVEHIFVCDHYKYESEMLDKPLKRYIDLGLITYFPWSNIKNAMQAQVKCYQFIIDTFKRQTRWQVAIDMDEYPFALHDHKEGFLVRYLRNMTYKYGTRLSEISMSNYLMLGQGDRKRKLVIDRINRMTPKPANKLVKPIYRPERVRANLHHNRVMYGSRMNADTDYLRMLHYWGARGQNWGPDTPHTLNITREMNDMRNTWPSRLRDSLLVFGEYDVFSNTTGP